MEADAIPHNDTGGNNRSADLLDTGEAQASLGQVAEQQFLVATDGGDGFGCDWADWAEPRLVGKDGKPDYLVNVVA